MIARIRLEARGLAAQLAVSVLVLAMFAGSIQNPAASAERRSSTFDPYRVELLYSEDDALCRPLGGLYNKLNHEHPGEFDWEDRYASQFNAIGLRQPKPLRDRYHPFQEAPRRAYYRLHFSGSRQTRLVYVEDEWFGGAWRFPH